MVRPGFVFSGSRLFVYGYDQVGNLTSDTVLGGVGASTFEHDKVDRLTKKVTLAGPVYYAYDLSGMRTSVKDPRLESTSFTLDAAGRRVRATVSDASDRLNYFAYDASGLMTTQALWQDAVLTYYTYDVAGRLKQLENRDSTLGLLTYFAYNRDPNGAITHVRLAADENAYFVYDALDRLQWERRFFTAGSPSIDSYYLYDAASNRTSLVDLSVTTDYVFDARNLLTSSSDTTNADEYTYDASQRMTRRRTAAAELGTSATSYFAHDQRDFPSSLKVLDQTGSTITDQSFRYNGPGERALVIGAQGGSTPIYFAHDGNRLLTERDENGFTYGRYRWGSLLESEDAESGTNEVPAVDERGSVDKLVGAGGTAVYDRFGKEVSNTLASTTRTRFMPEVFTRMNISQKYSLTPSGLYLPLIAATTVGPGAKIGWGLGRGGGPIDWGHDGPPIFGFVPLRGPWIPVPPIPTPLGEGKWVPPVRIARGGGQGPTVWGQSVPTPFPNPDDPRDPRDKPPPVLFGEEADKACIPRSIRVSFGGALHRSLTDFVLGEGGGRTLGGVAKQPFRSSDLLIFNSRFQVEIEVWGNPKLCGVNQFIKWSRGRELKPEDRNWRLDSGAPFTETYKTRGSTGTILAFGDGMIVYRDTPGYNLRNVLHASELPLDWDVSFVVQVVGTPQASPTSPCGTAPFSTGGSWNSTKLPPQLRSSFYDFIWVCPAEGLSGMDARGGGTLNTLPQDSNFRE